jgi:hypothetical protein
MAVGIVDLVRVRAVPGNNTTTGWPQVYRYFEGKNDDLPAVAEATNGTVLAAR